MMLSGVGLFVVTVAVEVSATASAVPTMNSKLLSYEKNV
jgi:hypothetical protein